MIASRWMRRSLIALSVVLVASAAFGQAQGTQQGGQFQPQVGQAGKDVVWVPTPQGLVDKMLDMAKVTPQDFVIDLGSGDGRTVITAAKRGARAEGVEFDPNMVALSKANAAKEGVAEKTVVHQRRSVRAGPLAGHRDHDVPAAADQPQAAAEDPRAEARDAHRVQLVRHGRLGRGRDRHGRGRLFAVGAPRSSGSCRRRWKGAGAWAKAS